MRGYTSDLVKRYYWLIIVLVFGAYHVEARPGALISYTLIKSFSDTDLKSFFREQHIPSFILGAKDGLNIYEVVYNTRNTDSSVIKVSGLLYVPQGIKRPAPILIYNHGTDLCRDRYFDGTGEQSICLAFATDGYMVLCPDYIGIGRSIESQLYLNASTEAGASVDMLVAVTGLTPTLGITTSKDLFVTGYSQGGHAAMATARLLEQQYKDKFPLTASSPMSGPYDIESTVYNARNKHNDHPGYLMFLLASYYQSIGHPIDMRTVLRSPYDTMIPPLLNGDWSMDIVDECLPDSVFKAVTNEFRIDFDKNKDSPFRQYLASNNVYDWKPESPMELCYCKGDDQVTYRNSITAYQTMKKNGSKSVELWHAGRKFKHVNCALFAVVYTKMFFDGFIDGHPRSHGPIFKRVVLQIGKLWVKP